MELTSSELFTLLAYALTGVKAAEPITIEADAFISSFDEKMSRASKLIPVLCDDPQLLNSQLKFQHELMEAWWEFKQYTTLAGWFVVKRAIESETDDSSEK